MCIVKETMKKNLKTHGDFFALLLFFIIFAFSAADVLSPRHHLSS